MEENKKNGSKDKVGSFITYYKNNIKTDKRLIIGTALIMIIVICLFALLMIDRSKIVADKFAKGMVNGDAKLFLDLYHEEYIDKIEDWQEEDFEDYLEKFFDEEFENYEIESYEITKVKEADEDDLEDIAEYLDEYYDIEEDSVKAMKTYTIKFIIDYDGDEEKEKIKLPVVKIDGKWFVFNLPDDFV